MFVTTLALRWLECTFHSVIVCIYALSRGRIINLRFTNYNVRLCNKYHFERKAGAKVLLFFDIAKLFSFFLQNCLHIQEKTTTFASLNS